MSDVLNSQSDENKERSTEGNVWQKLDNHTFNPENHYRVVNEAGYKDFQDTGVVRSSPVGTQSQMIGRFDLGGRPTSFPSFAKGAPDLSYLDESSNHNYIFETDIPMYGRGDTNPTNGNRIKGRHWAKRPIDTNTGRVIENMTPEMIRNIYKIDRDGGLYVKNNKENKPPEANDVRQKDERRDPNRYTRPKEILQSAKKLFQKEASAGGTANFVLEQRKKQQERSELARRREFEKKEGEKTLIEDASRREAPPEETSDDTGKAGRGVYQHARKRSFELAEKIFRDAKMPIDKEALEILTKTTPASSDYPTKSNFPVIIFSLAVIKDILDVPFDVSVVLVIAASIFSFFIGLVIFFWGFGKTNRLQRKLFKGFIKRWASMCVVELIPGLQVIPATAIFVLLAHFRETKFVETALKAIKLT